MFQRRTMHPSEIPVVVKNLLIINVILFVAKFIFENHFGKDILSDKLGLYFPLADQFHFYQFITYQFMHANFMHIAMNMLGLLFCGIRLEGIWGAKRFLIYYIVCGLGAGIIHMSWTGYQIHRDTKPVREFLNKPELGSFNELVNTYSFPNINPAWVTVHTDEVNRLARLGQTDKAITEAENMCNELLYDAYNNHVVVGASGAIFGILLAFGILFANTPVQLLFFPIPIPAKWLAIFIGLLEVLRTFENRPDDYVAHVAHLGGMAVGFIILRIYQRNRKDFY